MAKSLRRPALYLEVRKHVLGLIESGHLSSDGRLPTEIELSSELGVSRLTVRDALLSLEQEGLVERRRGVGTFAVSPAIRLKSRIDVLTSIPELIRSCGFDPCIRHLRVSESKEGPGWLSDADLASYESFTIVERLYLAGDTPAIWCVDYLPATLYRRPLDFSMFSGDMLAFLQHEHGITITHVGTRIKAVSADRAVAGKLEVRVGNPILLLEQVAYSSDETPAVFTRGYNRSDIVTYDLVRRKL